MVIVLFKKDKLKESLKKLNVGYIYSSYLDIERDKLFVVVDGEQTKE